jgi:dsRNA-specific ribonuclease
MQIYPINNINNNPKFGTLKGLRYAGEFNPSTNYEHAKIVDAVINSKAIKQFGEKYNFLARLKRSNGYEPITMTRFFGYYYSLELIPAPVERHQEPRLTLWERILGKKKNDTEAKPPVEETPKEEDKIQNLPIAFLVANVMEDYESDAIEKFISKISNKTFDDIERRLISEQYEQKEKQLAEKAENEEHALILNEIKDAGF